MAETKILTANVSSAEIEQLEKLYSFRDYPYDPEAFQVMQWRREDVFKFIDEHPFLIPLLLEIPEKLKPYFPDAKLFLEVHIDPEIVGDIELVVLIVTDFGVEEALAREEQFDNAWWFSNKSRTQNKLTIFTE